MNIIAFDGARELCCQFRIFLGWHSLQAAATGSQDFAERNGKAFDAMFAKEKRRIREENPSWTPCGHFVTESTAAGFMPHPG